MHCMLTESIVPEGMREREGFHPSRTLMSRTACALKVFQISSHTTVFRSTQADLQLTQLFICQTL